MNIDEKVNETIQLFHIASKTLKEAEQYLDVLTVDMYKEYQYISNHIFSFLYLSLNKKEDEEAIFESIIKSQIAIKIIINDSVDGVVDVCKKKILMLKSYNTQSLSYYYPEIHQLNLSIKSLDKLIAETRKMLSSESTNRIDIYKEMIKSEDYVNIKKFLDSFEVLENDIQNDFNKKINEDKARLTELAFREREILATERNSFYTGFAVVVSLIAILLGILKK